MIDGKKILCLPKGSSHDIDILLNPNDKNFKQNKRILNKRLRQGDWSAYYRVIGQSWWPQEKIDINKYIDFIEKHENETFDFICSHVPPAFVTEHFCGSVCYDEGERYFETIFDRMNFSYWFHGHLHNSYDNTVSGIGGVYTKVINMETKKEL